MSEATWWTTDAVEQWEASRRQWETYCAEKEREVRDCLRDLIQVCADGKKVQNENDRALQNLHEELGKVASAANQQELTALLIAPAASADTGERQTAAPATRQKRKASRSSRAVSPSAPDDMSDLRKTVAQTRERGKRFNFARIEMWFDEIKKAVQLGNYELVRRALAGLKADVEPS